MTDNNDDYKITGGNDPPIKTKTIIKRRPAFRITEIRDTVNNRTFKATDDSDNRSS